MATDGEQQQKECAWCGEPATTIIYAVGRPGLKNIRTAPVCDYHEQHFIEMGAVSQRSYHEEQVEKARRTNQQRREYFNRVRRG